MSDDEAKGAIGALTDLGGRVIGALPPAFLLLCLLNVAFLGVVMLFLNAQMEQRTAVVAKVLDACLTDRAITAATTARLDSLEHDVRVLEVKQK